MAEVIGLGGHVPSRFAADYGRGVVETLRSLADHLDEWRGSAEPVCTLSDAVKGYAESLRRLAGCLARGAGVRGLREPLRELAEASGDLEAALRATVRLAARLRE